MEDKAFILKLIHITDTGKQINLYLCSQTNDNYWGVSIENIKKYTLFDEALCSAIFHYEKLTFKESYSLFIEEQNDK